MAASRKRMPVRLRSAVNRSKVLRVLDPLAARRRRYHELFAATGLLASFESMPAPGQKFLLELKFPDPKVVIDDDAAATPVAARLAAECGKALREARVDLAAACQKAGMDGSWAKEGATVSARDLITISWSLHMMKIALDYNKTKLPPKVTEFWTLFAERLQPLFRDHYIECIRPLYDGLVAACVHAGRADGTVYSTRLEVVEVACRDPAMGKKSLMQIHLQADTVPGAVVALEGVKRRVTRAADMVAGKGSHWISWSPEVVENWVDPDARPKKDIPVWVQGHALHQLQARMDSPRSQALVQAWLGDALSRPRIVERLGRRDDGVCNLLVEYRYCDKRTGYLVVAVMPDMAVVRTFKFLTMSGTPEGRLLEIEMRLGRNDTDWLGLYKLSAFTQTDLRDDRLLRKMLRKCGCAQLFDLEAGDAAPRPVAERVREYLCLDGPATPGPDADTGVPAAQAA